MNKASWIRVSGLVCVIAVLAIGCGGGEEGASGGRDAEFQVIRDQKASIDAKRQEIADLEAQIAAAEMTDGEAAEAEEGVGEEAGEEGGEMAAASGDDLAAQLEQVENELAAESEAFMTALIGFLNTADMVQGEAPTGVNLEAIRMKSGEDLVIADEYVRKGGDYRRALEIIDTAMILDPDGPELIAARAKYDADQYMTEERFAMVSKGMTTAQVQEVLGTVNPHNVRNFEDKNVTAWYYRREDKGAAGVFFEEKDGEMKAYQIDFDAVKPEEEGEAESD